MSEITRQGLMRETDKKALKEQFSVIAGSHKLCATVLFPEIFFAPFSDRIHDPIFKLLDEDNEQRVAIAAPRGTGKTSIVNQLLPGKSIIFRERGYIVPVSCSATVAEQQSENLKYELSVNEAVKLLFGEFGSKVWGKEQWVADNDALGKGIGTCVMPRGAGQQIRGLKYLRRRPDLFIIDDLEDPDNMDNADMRKKKLDWFFGDLMEAIPRLMPEGAKPWRVLVLGTILHEDSLVSRLLDNPRWLSTKLQVCTNQFVSLWPEFITTEELKEDWKEAELEGTQDVFYREKMNEAVSAANRSFGTEYFQYYEETDKEFEDRKPFLQNIVIYDPARKAETKSADTAIVGVGIDASDQKIYLRNVIKGKMYPNEQYDALFAMAQAMHCKVIAVETRGLEEFIMQPLKNEAAARGLNFEWVICRPRGGKDSGKGQGKVERVGSLISYYRLKQVVHNRAFAGMIEPQLLAYPKSKLWDVMDAFGYIPQLMEEGLIYFNKGLDNDTPESVAKEFEELYSEYGNEMDEFEVQRYMAEMQLQSNADQEQVRII